MAALDHLSDIVLGQVGVDGKTSELTRFQPLLAPLDLVGKVITADALHTQREHARYLVDRLGRLGIALPCCRTGARRRTRWALAGCPVTEATISRPKRSLPKYRYRTKSMPRRCSRTACPRSG